MINFPSSPTLNQEYIYNGRIWKYNGTGWALKINDAVLTPTVITNSLGYAPLSDVTSTDGSVAVTTAGTVKDLSVTLSGSTNNLLVGVRNTTGATLTKGTAVYISGASGQRSLVAKALATSDATSAQTLGLITSDITNNSNGNVTAIGLISNIDTSAYTDGQQLYLSPTTAGALTATKPTAPNHMVYVAVVEYAHATQGKLFVKVQNGYELDEVHDVAITSVATNDFLVRNASNLWVNQPAATARASMGLGTAATTASTAYATAAQGTKADSALQINPALGTPLSGNFSTGTFTWPTFNQNTTGTAGSTTGTASNITGIAAIANGGTGQTTSSTAFTALAPSQTSNTGKYLKTNGTIASWETVDALPSQTSNAGKYLTTDGTSPSWNTLNTDANTTTKGLYEMANVISTSYSITAGNNAISTGTITVNNGVTVTVPSGSTWAIV
jgi:hypothetical protein